MQWQRQIRSTSLCGQGVLQHYHHYSIGKVCKPLLDCLVVVVRLTQGTGKDRCMRSVAHLCTGLLSYNKSYLKKSDSPSKTTCNIYGSTYCILFTLWIQFTDNGTEFINQLLHYIWQHFQIKQTFIAAYHLVPNGLSKRTIRKILDTLSHFTGCLISLGKTDSLTLLLLLVAQSDNALHFILFGSDKRLPYAMFL